MLVAEEQRREIKCSCESGNDYVALCLVTGGERTRTTTKDIRGGGLRESPSCAKFEGAIFDSTADAPKSGLSVDSHFVTGEPRLNFLNIWFLVAREGILVAN